MESGNRAAKLTCEFLKGNNPDLQKDYTEYMMQGINTFRTYVNGWYSGDLHEIFFAEEPEESVKSKICSVLAGYVWDMENPYVKKHERAVKALADMLKAKNNITKSPLQRLVNTS